MVDDMSDGLGSYEFSSSSSLPSANPQKGASWDPLQWTMRDTGNQMPEISRAAAERRQVLDLGGNGSGSEVRPRRNGAGSADGGCKRGAIVMARPCGITASTGAMQVGGQCIGLPLSPVSLKQAFRSLFMLTSAILRMPALAGVAMPSSALIVADMTLA
jgi:hypothetical protein